MREQQQAIRDSEYKDQLYFEHLNTTIKNSSKYSSIDSQIPYEARVTAGRSNSRDRGSMRSISKGIKASRGYRDIHDLRQDLRRNGFN